MATLPHEANDGAHLRADLWAAHGLVSPSQKYENKDYDLNIEAACG